MALQFSAIAQCRPGVHFQEELEKRLSDSKTVILIWSRNAKTSRWTLAEAEAAADQNKLVPIRFDDTDLPLSLRGIHTQDALTFERFLPQFAAQYEPSRQVLNTDRYYAYIYTNHSQIQILGMSKPIPLERVYVDLRLSQTITTKTYIDLVERSIISPSSCRKD